MTLSNVVPYCTLYDCMFFQTTVPGYTQSERADFKGVCLRGVERNESSLHHQLTTCKFHGNSELTPCALLIFFTRKHLPVKGFSKKPTCERSGVLIHPCLHAFNNNAQ